MRRQSVDEATIESAVNQCLDVWWAEQVNELDGPVGRPGQDGRSAPAPGLDSLADLLTPADIAEPKA